LKNKCKRTNLKAVVNQQTGDLSQLFPFFNLIFFHFISFFPFNLMMLKKHIRPKWMKHPKLYVDKK